MHHLVLAALLAFQSPTTNLAPMSRPDQTAPVPYTQDLTAGPFEVTTSREIRFERDGRDLQCGNAPNAGAARIEALTTHATLAFLDLYIKDLQPARAWLENTAPDKFEGVHAECLSK